MEQVTMKRNKKTLKILIILGLALVVSLIGVTATYAGFAHSQQVNNESGTALQIGADGLKP